MEILEFNDARNVKIQLRQAVSHEHTQLKRGPVACNWQDYRDGTMSIGTHILPAM